MRIWQLDATIAALVLGAAVLISQLGCAPSAYVQRQDAALALYDEGRARVMDRFSDDGNVYVRDGATVGAVQDGLALVRARYAPALWALIAVQLAHEHAGVTHDVDIVPATCAMVAAARGVGVVLDAGELCVVPTCWEAGVDGLDRSDVLVRSTAMALP